MTIKEMISKVKKASAGDLFELAGVTSDALSDLSRLTCMVDNETAKRLREIDYSGLTKRPVRTKAKGKEPVRV
jgi:hypothetical protein